MMDAVMMAIAFVFFALSMSHLVQMLGLTHQNYLSAATGIVLSPKEL